jgi:hypothetical protein
MTSARRRGHATIEQSVSSRLGDENCQRVVEFKAWLDQQESSGPILAFPKEMPGSDSFPKVMRPELRQLRD